MHFFYSRKINYISIREYSWLEKKIRIRNSLSNNLISIRNLINWRILKKCPLVFFLASWGIKWAIFLWLDNQQMWALPTFHTAKVNMASRMSNVFSSYQNRYTWFLPIDVFLIITATRWTAYWICVSCIS